MMLQRATNWKDTLGRGDNLCGRNREMKGTDGRRQIVTGGWDDCKQVVFFLICSFGKRR